MIYLDRDGKLKVDESSSIKEQNSTVFTPEVRQNFLEILGERIGYHAPTRRMSNLHFQILKEMAMHTNTIYRNGYISSSGETSQGQRSYSFCL
jgi:hypothetical protein